MMAMVAEVKLVAVMVVMAAEVSAMPTMCAARGRVARGQERDGSSQHNSDGMETQGGHNFPQGEWSSLSE
jgi:hypothetical protein